MITDFNGCDQYTSKIPPAKDKFEVFVNIPFKTQKEATIAYNSLRIDEEPSRGEVTKILGLYSQQPILIVRMSSNTPRKLRSAVSSFFDLLILVVNTIEQYG